MQNARKNNKFLSNVVGANTTVARPQVNHCFEVRVD